MSWTALVILSSSPAAAAPRDLRWEGSDAAAEWFGSVVEADGAFASLFPALAGADPGPAEAAFRAAWSVELLDEKARLQAQRARWEVERDLRNLPCADAVRHVGALEVDYAQAVAAVKEFALSDPGLHAELERWVVADAAFDRSTDGPLQAAAARAGGDAPAGVEALLAVRDRRAAARDRLSSLRASAGGAARNPFDVTLARIDEILSIKATPVRALTPADLRKTAMADLAQDYDLLLRQTDALPTELERPSWCGLLVRRGVSALLGLDDPGPLGDAASAFDRGCAAEVSPYLAAPVVQAAWGSAALKRAAGTPNALAIPGGIGAVRVDGLLLPTGEQRLSILAGLHRFEVLTSDGHFAHMNEVLQHAENLVLYPLGDGLVLETAEMPESHPMEIAYQPLRPGSEVVRETSVVVVSGEGGAGGAARPSFLAGGAWFRFDGRDHVGLRMGGRIPLVATPRTVLAADFGIQSAWGDNAYRQTDSFGASTMLVGCAGLLVTTGEEWSPAGMSPGLFVGAGAVLPADAAYFEGGAELRYGRGRQVAWARAGASFTVWSDAVTPLAPLVQAGLAWRL